MARTRETVEVVVTIDDQHAGKLKDVVEKLKGAGMTVKEAMAGVGIVSGSISAAKLKQLEKIKGVAAVERSREIRLPPRESDLQ